MPDQMDPIRRAVERADETLALLDRVPVADTVQARHAMDGVRLEVLSRFRDDVSAALPAEPEPAAPELRSA